MSIAEFSTIYTIFTDCFSPKIYKFSQSSLAELARNSVIQSGFEMEVKRRWLGQEWYLPGSAGNDINKVRIQSDPDLGLEGSNY